MGAAGRALVAHVQTWRPYTVCYPGLVGLAGAAVATGADGGRAPTAWPTAAWLAPMLGWIGGHYLGDWFDRRLDAIGKPQRPIPSGRMAAGTALTCGLLAMAGAAAVALTVGGRAVLLVVGALVGIVAYSRIFKGRGLAGNLTRGLLTVLALLFGAMTVHPLPPPAALVFAFAFCLHDTSSNLVGTLRDVSGDRAGGFATLPVRHGMRTAARIAAGCYAAAVLTALAALLAVPPAFRTDYLALLMIAAMCGVSVFTAVLLGAGTLTPRAALRAHECLVGERLLLAGAVLSTGTGAGPALALTAPVLAFSLLTQASMRTAHELLPAKGAGQGRGRLTDEPLTGPAAAVSHRASPVELRTTLER